ncbi:PREDICTED: two-component response regulator ARR17-like isoform X3 [Populus euphratica]|nr:PREDICTED: two-component response regulator ARR17-like isoform X3 [Populus euphratica]
MAGCSSSSPSMGFDFDEKPHVLAVDDGLIDRKAIERLLIKSEYKGLEGEPDHHRLLHGRNDRESPTMKEIPVVIVSSENIPARIKQCMEEEAQEFLLKPLQLSDVTKLSAIQKSRTIHHKEALQGKMNMQKRCQKERHERKNVDFGQ